MAGGSRGDGDGSERIVVAAEHDVDRAMQDLYEGDRADADRGLAEVVARYGDSDSVLTLRQVARATLMLAQGSSAVVDRFAEADDPELRQYAARALYVTGGSLADFEARFGADPDSAVGAYVLDALDRHGDWDGVIARSAGRPEWARWWASATCQKARALLSTDPSRAARLCDEVIDRFPDAAKVRAAEEIAERHRPSDLGLYLVPGNPHAPCLSACVADAFAISAPQRLRLALPFDVAVLPDGALLIADPGSHRVFRMSMDGSLQVLAGTGEAGFAGDDGPAVDASLNGPTAAVPAPGGGVLIADCGNRRVRRVRPDGTIVTLLDHSEQALPDRPVQRPAAPRRGGLGGLIAAVLGGNPSAEPPGPTTAPKACVWQLNPVFLGVCPDGAILVAVPERDRVLRVELGGVGVVPVRLEELYGLAAEPDGGFLVSQWDRIERVAADGTVGTLRGPSADATDDDSAMRPGALCRTPDGALLIAEPTMHRVSRLTRDGTIVVVAGRYRQGSELDDGGIGGDGGPAADAELAGPRAAVMLPDGRIAIADTGNHRIRLISSDGTIDTLGCGRRTPGQSS